MRVLYISITVLVLFIVGYVLWWNHIASTLETQALLWKQQRIAEGYEIDHEPLVASGFPYRVRVSTENLSISNPTHFQEPSIKLTRFWAVVQPWQINHVIFGIEGASEANWIEDKDIRTLRLGASSALGSATFNNQGRLGIVALDIADLRADPSWREPINAERLQLHGRPAPSTASDPASESENTQQIAIRSNNISVGGMDDFPLGSKIEELAVSTLLYGTIKKLPSAETLVDWRDRGGYLDIQSLNVLWGPAAFEGKGQLTIDHANRPIGRSEVQISGFEEILQALTSTGKMTPEMARTIRFALNLLARQNENGQKYLNLPLTAEDGGVYLGPVFLLRLKPLF